MLKKQYAFLDPPRNIKTIIFHNNEHTNTNILKLDLTPEECREKRKHTTSVLEKTKLLTLIHHYSIIKTYDIRSSKQTLPCHTHTKMVHLKANESPLLQSYLHTVNPET